MSKENKRQKSTRFSTDLSAQKHFYSSLKLLSDRKHCNLHIYGKINNSQFLLSNVMIGENENVCILLTFRALLNEWFIDRCEMKKIKISHAINHCRKETKCGFLFSNASYLNTRKKHQRKHFIVFMNYICMAICNLLCSYSIRTTLTVCKIYHKISCKHWNVKGLIFKIKSETS